MERFGMLRLDLYLAGASFLFPFGWSVSGFKPSILLACFCWLVTLTLLIHAFWIYEKTSSLSTSSKWLASVAIFSVVVVIAWRPVADEYRRENFIVDSGRFIATLMSQRSPRNMVRIGCSAYQEDSCVYAGHFMDFFKQAGWVVEGNSVQRVVTGRPEAGLLMFVHGRGQADPDNPSAGLWALQTESMKTIEAAFEAIGLRVGRRADNGFPVHVIGIHFGYNAVTP